MELRGLQHCGLIVADVERSRWFYGTVLGMEEVPRPKNFKFDGAWFRSPTGDELHLIAARDTTAPAGLADPGEGKHSGLALHYAFEVADVEAAMARLAEHNIELVGGPLLRGDGARQIYVNDPDGHLVEFFQWVALDGIEAPDRGAVS